ncbi:MAG: YifB family Mg chelatase-like AAA ATPase [Frankia sp.]|nr:YifB family Mg chelatase-like AAA ATPase [Frankia sp.]
MTLARALGVAVVGVDGHLVEVEADLADGLPCFTLIGLPDAALAEARDRIRAAIVNSGESWPSRRLTVGLSPATLRKSGSGFDVAMAAAVLAAAGVVPATALAGVVVLGELALDGRVRRARGILPAVLAASRAGIERIVVPHGNVAEAELVPGVRVHGVRDLRDLLRLLRGEPPLESPDPLASPGNQQGERSAAARSRTDPLPDLADVLGQPQGRRALEVAAAGGHHLYLLGPPGAGKTMLAERLPSLLPALEFEAALEVTAVHSVAGTLPADCPLITTAPFRSPHHTATVAALVGGGSGYAKPGEASLAHFGVLLLDEAPEFASGVLDALRQPLESGVISIARSGATTRYPAKFTLVLAANPCPCANSTQGALRCTCSSTARRRYLGRLSGPLLDRIDMQVVLYAVSRADLLTDRSAEPSAIVAARVAQARARASARLAGTPWRTNAEVPGRELRRRWPPRRGDLSKAARALENGALTARGFDRVLRVAWTLADLADRERPGNDEIDEALSLKLMAAA